MQKTIDFLNEIIEEFADISWAIDGIVDYKEVTEDDETYAELENGLTFEKQDNYYIYQTQHGDDWFGGTIIYPIEGNKGLVINYSC